MPTWYLATHRHLDALQCTVPLESLGQGVSSAAAMVLLFKFARARAAHFNSIAIPNSAVLAVVACLHPHIPTGQQSKPNTSYRSGHEYEAARITFTDCLVPCQHFNHLSNSQPVPGLHYS